MLLRVSLAPHVGEGASFARINLAKSTRPDWCGGCFLCGGDPLYRVTWDTPGAWWGDTHSEDYCHACVTDRGIREGWVDVVCPPMSPVQYGVLCGNAWMDVPLGDIRGWIAQGSIPTREWITVLRSA